MVRIAAEVERFFLFHRKRVWNECDGKWMGWERKRGKLHELNQLLARFDEHHVHTRRRAASRSACRAFATSSRSMQTRACHEALLPRLVGTMAHPLNRPKFSARRTDAS